MDKKYFYCLVLESIDDGSSNIISERSFGLRLTFDKIINRANESILELNMNQNLFIIFILIYFIFPGSPVLRPSATQRLLGL